MSEQLEIEIPTPPDQPESLAALWVQVNAALANAKTALLEVEETVNYALYQIPADLSADFSIIALHRAEIEKETTELDMSISDNSDDELKGRPTLSEERTLKVFDAAVYALARLTEALGRVRSREIAEMEEAGAVVRLAGDKGGVS